MDAAYTSSSNLLYLKVNGSEPDYEWVDWDYYDQYDPRI